MALKNTQTSKQYNSKRVTKENTTKVSAKEYDTTQVTKKNQTKVTSTVEGN